MKCHHAALLAVCCWVWAAQVTSAESRDPLAEDQETPDPLLQSTQPEERAKRYGSEGIYIQEGGDKDASQVSPDPLERSVQPPPVPGQQVPVQLPGLEREPPEAEQKKGKKTDSRKGSELQTPDPLLDNIGR